MKKILFVQMEVDTDDEPLNITPQTWEPFRHKASVDGRAELEKLTTEHVPTRYKKKEIIFHEGDLPHYLFYLKQGKVKTYKSHDDGKEYITTIYKKGDFFGYLSLAEDSCHSDSALAFEDSLICKIPKNDFINLIYKNRNAMNTFIKLLSNNIHEKERQLLSLAYSTVRRRVAESLLILDEQYQNNDHEHAYIPISREDLAGMAGTATETVIRSLSELKAAKLIAVKGRDILVLNPEGLQNVC